MTSDLSLPLEGPSFKVIPKPGSHKLMIFFSGTDRKDGLFDFWNVARQQDANVILTNNGINAWYQYGVPGLGETIDETVASFRSWAERLGASEISTYGVSMGGYGAVLFATRLECPALAFGIDTRLRIGGSRSRKRMPKAVESVVPDLRPEMVRSKGRFMIYAGEADTLDLVGATHVMGIPNTTVVSLRGVGHGGAPFLDKELGLAKLVSDFSDGLPLPKSAAQGSLCSNPDAVALLWKASENKRLGRLAAAESFAQAAYAFAPDAEAAMYMLGDFALERRDYVQALHYLKPVCRLVPHFAGAQLKLATCLRRLGKKQEAMDAYRRLLVLKPESALGMFWLGRLLEAEGSTEQALDYIKQAVAIKPDQKLFSDYLQSMLVRAGEKYSVAATV